MSKKELDETVLAALQHNGYLTRPELVGVLNEPRTTIFDSLVRLERAGQVDYFFEARIRRGRPKTYWHSTVEAIGNVG